jgi:hypothetical protein
MSTPVVLCQSADSRKVYLVPRAVLLLHSHGLIASPTGSQTMLAQKSARKAER